jgi:hypothetical protein
MLFEVKIVQGVHSGCGSEQYVTALAAVSTIWAPFGDIFLTSKTHAAIAAITRLDPDQSFIKKFHRPRLADGTLLLMAVRKCV